MPHVRRVGLEAEDAAAEYLSAQGYTILKRRFRARGGEIDLIGLDGKVLAFVEIKLRRSREKDPLDSMNVKKQECIFAAADSYLSKYDGPPCEVRYDVVTVVPNGMTLHKDAFRPR